MTTKASVQVISPDRIERNPENPRLVFKKKQMQILLESVEKRGVIVPLIVYPEGEKFKLLDGERRLRISRRLNLQEVPVNIIAKPTPVQNILQMFHIHNVKDTWELIETAMKLKVLLEDPAFKDKSSKEIAELAGLSPTTVNRCKDLLSLDPKYQKLILDTYKRREQGEELDSKTKLTEDFFIESKRAIASIRKFQKDVYDQYDEEEILAKFVKKRKLGTFSNVIEIGRLIPKIVSAGRKGGSQEKTSLVIRHLIEEPKFTISEAYEAVAEPIVMSVNIEKRCAALIDDLSQLQQFRKKQLGDRRQELLKILQRLSTVLNRTISELE